jgi:hypothetical protein
VRREGGGGAVGGSMDSALVCVVKKCCAHLLSHLPPECLHATIMIAHPPVYMPLLACAVFVESGRAGCNIHLCLIICRTLALCLCGCASFDGTYTPFPPPPHPCLSSPFPFSFLSPSLPLSPSHRSLPTGCTCRSIRVCISSSRARSGSCSWRSCRCHSGR